MSLPWEVVTISDKEVYSRATRPRKYRGNLEKETIGEQGKEGKVVDTPFLGVLNRFIGGWVENVAFFFFFAVLLTVRLMLDHTARHLTVCFPPA